MALWWWLAAHALEATWILGMAAGATILLRRAPAATRHALLAAALAAVLAAPLLDLLPLPRWEAPAPAAAAVEWMDADAGVAMQRASAPAVAGWNWRALAAGLWMLVAAALVARLVTAQVRVARLIRRGEHDGAGCVYSNEVAIPMAAGVFRPVVVLPAAARGWCGGRVRAVMAHEQGHLRRRDPLTNLVARVACTAYWFHPLAWWALRRLALERERACDDLVLASGLRASEYAAELVELARGAGRDRAWAAAVSMAQPSQLEPRVRAILSRTIPRRPLSARGMALIGCAAALTVVPAATVTVSRSHSISQFRSSEMSPRFAVPFLAAAALQAAAVTGSVFDASSAVIPGVTVVLRDSKTGAEQRTKTGPAGEYSFAALAAGAYEVEVLAPGFARWVRRGVSVGENSQLVLNAVLRIGEVQESMVVEGKGAARAQAAGPKRIRVGGNVQATKLVRHVRPAYPEKARAEGREGHVTLQAVIGVNGEVINVRVMPGVDQDLAEAAEQAVRQWRYEPTLLNGVPVETITTVEITFRLSQ